MVDIQKIKEDIEALKNLNAQEYCKEQVEKLYAEFEANKESQIAELEKSLEIYEKYQIKEEFEEEQIEQETEGY